MIIITVDTEKITPKEGDLLFVETLKYRNRFIAFCVSNNETEITEIIFANNQMYLYRPRRIQERNTKHIRFDLFEDRFNQTEK